MRADPLANPEPLIRRVYSYVAYRLSDGTEAEDVTSEVFERALRYRESFDDSRGAPIQWLLGIARRCVQDALASRARVESLEETGDGRVSSEDIGHEAVERLALSAALAQLDDRSRDLLALRYGADLTARQIGELTEMNTNAVEVALHRALSRLRGEMGEWVDERRTSAIQTAQGLSGHGTIS